MRAKRRLRFIAPVVAVALVALVVLIPRRHVQLYKVTVLPTLGAAKTHPTAINDRGQVVGITEDRGDIIVNLFLWDRANGMTDLGPVRRHPPHINNAGQIAATMIDPNGIMQAFLWDPENGRRMLVNAGNSMASNLNNRGQVVGTLFTARSKLPGTRWIPRQAFIWDKVDGMRKLFPIARWESEAFAINDAGQVMGRAGTYNSRSHLTSCFWHSTFGGSLTPLRSPIDYPGGDDLNNNGCVIGTTYHWDKSERWAYLWTAQAGPEAIKYLFPVERPLAPRRINDANQVLYGERCVNSFQRFSKKLFPPHEQRCVWDPQRGKIVLDKQVPQEIGKLLHVRDINNRGCIIGIIRSAGLGQELAVLLEPIPERWGK